MSRRRHRYLLVKVVGKGPSSAQGVQDAVDRSVVQMFGRFGSAEMKPRLVGFDPASGRGVLRCALMSVEKLRASVALISQINGQTAMGSVIRSSGTIRGLRVRFPRREKRRRFAAAFRPVQTSKNHLDSGSLA